MTSIELRIVIETRGPALMRRNGAYSLSSHIGEAEWTCGPTTNPNAAKWPCCSPPELLTIDEKVQNARHWPLGFCQSSI